MEVYEVGGAVRDSLLGRPVTERDWVVVGATPGELLKLGYRQVGRDFPVFLHPDSKEEYALARLERKIAPGHTGFAFDTARTVTLEDDLARRDLTVNAIAKDGEGRLIDPFGGQADLRERKLRHVSEAFREDPLRVLRTARFAAQLKAFEFSVAEETLALMADICRSGELQTLQPERVWRETHKALTSPRPDVFFSVLRDCTALSIVFPEVDRLFGVPQPARWHPEIDTGVHTLMALRLSAELSDKPEIRFAVLAHDFGKGTTPKEILPSHRGHEQRSVDLLERFGARIPVPNRFMTLAVHVARYHGQVHRVAEMRPAKIYDLIAAVDGLRQPERFEDFLLACEADARGRTGFEQRAYVQAEQLRRAQSAALAVRANGLQALGLDGPALGAALRERRIAAIAATRATSAADPPA